MALLPTDTANLVRRTMGGDVEAYSDLVVRFRDAVFGLCYHRCGDFEAARDLAQDTLIRAYQRLHQLSQPERFPAWLRRIAERVCIDWRRRQREERPLPDAAEQPQRASEELAALRVTVERALSALPEAERLAVTLFHINGYSYREIAQFVSAPETTIKARLDAARQRLRGALAEAFREALQAQRPLANFNQEVMMRVTQVQMKEAVNQKEGGRAPVLLLSGEDRTVAMYIGAAEAQMIRAALDKWEAPRPMTYDLMLKTWAAFGIRLTSVRIADLRDNIYFAEVELTRGKSAKRVDCRASDAVNLALRADVPVEIDQAVVEKGGISAEEASKDYGNLPDYPTREPDVPPLHQAVAAGNAGEVERVLAGGEDPNKPNRHGVTPLGLASMQGWADVSKLLLARGAEPNAKDPQGRTHLHWAAHNGHRNVADLLLAAGAEINAKDASGATPLHVATDPEMVQLLASRGADVNAADASGRTPLHYAASRGLTQVVAALLAAGAEVNASDRADATALRVARGAETEALLRQHGGR